VSELQGRARAFDRQQVLATYSRARALNEADPQIHFTAGRLLGLTGAYAEAIAAFDRGFALQPNHVEAALDLALLHRQNGRISAAEAALARVRSYDPHSRHLRP
jgi:tetratricopeptide (TPR) repeat protein